MTSLLVFLSLFNLACVDNSSSTAKDDLPIENEIISLSQEAASVDGSSSAVKDEHPVENELKSSSPEAGNVDIVSGASEPWEEEESLPLRAIDKAEEEKKVEKSADATDHDAKTNYSDYEGSKDADVIEEAENENVESKLSKNESVGIRGSDGNREEEDESETKEDLFQLEHTAFDALLKKHVSSKGVVNYSGFKNDLGKLDAYLEVLASNPVAASWSRNEKLAYWINAYNAFTIKLILDNYPVNSIQDIAGGKPWDKKWIVLGSATYSLNQIENEIIRPQFNEPRIHFAVNCAAQSCPPLANQAFTESNMESLLEKQTKSFINNSKYNQISTKSAKVSKIFDWYAQDFGDLRNFLNKYSSKSIKSNVEIGYNEYDWGLNNK